MFQIKLTLFLCAFVTNIFLATSNTMVFNTVALQEAGLFPEYHRINFNATATVKAQNYNNSSNIFIVQVLSVNITLIDFETKEVKDLFECESYKDVEENLYAPFIMNYNENGILENVQVSKEEPPLSANLKFLLGSALQMDKVPLMGHDEPQFFGKSNELTMFGQCDVDYFVEQPIPNPDKKYSVVKRFHPLSCKTSHPTHFDDEFLNKTCSSHLHKMDMTQRNGDATVVLTPPSDFPLNTYMNNIFQMNYRPFSDRTDRFLAATTLKADLVELIDEEPITINEDGLVTLKEYIFTPVNVTLFQELDNPTASALEKILLAEDCCPYMNLFSQMVEQSLFC